MSKKRIQPFQLQNRRKASRTSPLSPELKRLIDQVNMIPPKSEGYWREFCDFLQLQVRRWREIEGMEVGDGEFASIMSVVKPWEWERYLEPLPKWFSDRILSRRRILAEMLDEACSFVAARQTIRHIARTRSEMQEYKRRGLNLPPTDIPIPAITIAPDAFLSLRQNESGKIDVTLGEVAKALAGTEVDRIRECCICKQVFWARRKDQICCVTKCSKVLRTRRWRAKAPEYKLRRILKAELADPLGRNEKHTESDRERQQIAYLREPTRPHRRAPRMPGTTKRSKPKTR